MWGAGGASRFWFAFWHWLTKLNVLSCVSWPFVSCLFKSLAHLPLVSLLFVQVLSAFQTKILCCIHVLQIPSSTHCLPFLFFSLNGIFWWVEIANFNVVQFIFRAFVLGSRKFCLPCGRGSFFFWEYQFYLSHFNLTFFVYGGAKGQDWIFLLPDG